MTPKMLKSKANLKDVQTGDFVLLWMIKIKSNICLLESLSGFSGSYNLFREGFIRKKKKFRNF